MPRIIVQTEAEPDTRPDVVHQERVVAGCMESEHFSTQLVERLQWALADAEAAERCADPPAGAER